MAKRPTFGIAKPKRAAKPTNPFAPAKPAKTKTPPAMRKTQFENLLCKAIAERLTVLLRYEDDLHFREFAPLAVYFSDSAKRKVLVSGQQISNPNDYRAKNEPHNFEVGKIADLKLGSNTFNHDARASLTDNKYRHGIICTI